MKILFSSWSNQLKSLLLGNAISVAKEILTESNMNLKQNYSKDKAKK